MVKQDDIVVLGHITGLHGVNGWVKVFSDTSPRDNILSYSPWLIRQPGKEWQAITVTLGRKQGKGIVAHLQGYDDRDTARLLMGFEIAVYRNQLASLEHDEYYWADLQGLTVKTLAGQTLGIVDHLFATGANDVVVVTGERERLIPFLQGRTIMNIDLRAGIMQVDWDPDF
jgi:16S rRNA processing protein RimM